MPSKHAWKVGLWLIAAYITVTALVRFMLQRRSRVIGELNREIEAGRKARQASANPKG